MSILLFDLQFFAEGGGAGAGASAGAGEGAADAAVSSDAEGNDGGNAAAEGKQDADESPKKETRRSLKQLLREDEGLKKEFDSIFDKRFAKSKATEEQLAKVGEALPYLQQYYGTADDDLDGLVKAIKADDGLFKRKGVERGTSAATERENFDRDMATKKQIAENKRLRAELDEREKAIQQERLFRKLDEDIPKVREKYPDFDLIKESNDPLFAELAVRYGVMDAYEIVHRDEINARLVDDARKQAASQVADSVAANISRPVEGGVSRNASPPVKTDLESYILKNRDAIRQSVKRGEKVSFKDI